MGAPGCGSGVVQGPRELVLDSFLPFFKELEEFWLSPCLGGPWGGLARAGGCSAPTYAPVGLFWCGSTGKEKQQSWKWV